MRLISLSISLFAGLTSPLDAVALTDDTASTPAPFAEVVLTVEGMT